MYNVYKQLNFEATNGQIYPHANEQYSMERGITRRETNSYENCYIKIICVSKSVYSSLSHMCHTMETTEIHR